MDERRPQLLETLNRLYEERRLEPAAPDAGSRGPVRPVGGRVSLVGAGPGDPELWTVRAARLVREADLVLYDALVDSVALRGLTDAPCFHVGKRAGRTASSRRPSTS
jgi:hypothetical protein